MGEIDTKPIESVQAAISFFGQKNSDHQRINSPTNKDDDDQQESDKDRELERLMKELASLKLQLEAKDSAYKQTLLKLHHHQQTADDLSTLLKNSDLKKNFYINESRAANVRVDELESVVKTMNDKLSDNENVKEQLSRVTDDLVSTKTRLVDIETELANLREAKAASTSKAEAMESALNEEKLKTEELLRGISEMNETNLETKVLEIEREKAEAVSEKEAEIELAKKELYEAHYQLEFTKEQLETMGNLENELLHKSAFIDSLKLELKQANECQISAEKVASDAISELQKLKREMEVLEEKKADRTAYISLLETELEKLRTRIEKARVEASQINEHVEEVKYEFEKSKEKENDLQVEIALLKFELHKGRSKLAAAEAAECKLQSEKSALYNALQQMGLEAEEAKRANRLLKEAIKSADDSKSSETIESSEQIQYQAEETQENYDMAIVGYEKGAENEDLNQVLDPMTINGEEVENMKKELELAMSKMGELRTRAEQAISRAEAAEKAKVGLEDKIKKQKEHRERRKAALAALKEESVAGEFISPTDNIAYGAGAVKRYQPLGKVLNMKF